MKAERNLPLDALESAARTLLEAVQVARGILSPKIQAVSSLPDGPPTVCEVANEFLLAKARAGRSDNYVGLLHKQMTAFAKGREVRELASVTASEIESWIYDNDLADKTRHGNLLTLRTLFAFAVARGYLASNPALAVDLPILTSAERGVHSPGQVRQVLESCSDANTLRFLAIRYFAGLRGSEACALAETEIRDGFILVCAAKAKTRQRRLVTIQPNLRAWLDESKRCGGSLPLRQANNRLCAAVKAAAVPWPDNVTRHSFCSYHLSAFANAGRTAMEAGHTEEMLFRNYRELMTCDGELITPALSREFWEISP